MRSYTTETIERHLHMDNELITAAITYVKDLFEGNSDGHGFDHTMRVYNNAMEIAKKESCDTQIVALAALLHDADDKHNIDGETVEAVISAVNSVSFSKNRDKKPESIEGRIVQDADRLDALGAIGIARTFSYGGKHGRSMEDSILHFHEKLLLLKDMMNTATAVKLAEKRHDFMVEFLKEWAAENPKR